MLVGLFMLVGLGLFEKNKNSLRSFYFLDFYKFASLICFLFFFCV